MTDVAKMICEVKQDISCKPVTRKKSKIIKYEVCEEKEAPQNCKPMTIRKPKQVSLILYIFEKKNSVKYF